MQFLSKIIHFLKDNSSARDEMLEVESVLKEVLATYQPEESFKGAVRRVMETRSPGSSFHRLPYFMKFIARYQKRNAPDPFVTARYFLEDLAAIYGISRD